MDIKLYDNELTATECNLLRQSVGWGSMPQEQIKQALENGLYTVVAKDGNDVVGMGRLVGDGIMYWYFQDIIVRPEYQSKSIGNAIMQRLIDYVYTHSLPNTTVTLGLMAAKDKEEFYKKFDFISRPSNAFGAGMISKITIQS